MIVVVHGVRTPESAEALATAGAEVLIVAARDLLDGWGTGRWAAALPRGQLAMALSDAAGPEIADVASRIRYVQTTWGNEPPAWLLESVRNGTLTWILDAVPADLDDDPAWVAARFKEYAPHLPAWVELDLNASYEDAWPLLMELRDDELDIRDVDDLAAHTRLVFAISRNVDRFAEMRHRLPHAYGWSLTVASEDQAGLDDVLRMLGDLNPH